jgi:hypothetical protein
MRRSSGSGNSPPRGRTRLASKVVFTAIHVGLLGYVGLLLFNEAYLAGFKALSIAGAFVAGMCWFLAVTCVLWLAREWGERA